jgi:hypothetical protein
MFSIRQLRFQEQLEDLLLESRLLRTRIEEVRSFCRVRLPRFVMLFLEEQQQDLSVR